MADERLNMRPQRCSVGVLACGFGRRPAACCCLLNQINTHRDGAGTRSRGQPALPPHKAESVVPRISFSFVCLDALGMTSKSIDVPSMLRTAFLKAELGFLDT